MIKVELELANSKISDISISGDFFMYPEESIEKLEQGLRGVEIKKKKLLEAVQKFYSTTRAQTPMVEPKHWVEAILRAVGE